MAVVLSLNDDLHHVSRLCDNVFVAGCDGMCSHVHLRTATGSSQRRDVTSAG